MNFFPFHPLFVDIGYTAAGENEKTLLRAGSVEQIKFKFALKKEALAMFYSGPAMAASSE